MLTTVSGPGRTMLPLPMDTYGETENQESVDVLIHALPESLVSIIVPDMERFALFAAIINPEVDVVTRTVGTCEFAPYPAVAGTLFPI